MTDAATEPLAGAARWSTRYPLFAVEGPDAAGKATVAAGLRARLTEAGHECLLVSMPDYSTATGRALRDHLLGCWAAVGTVPPGHPLPGRSHPVQSAAAHDAERDMMVRQALMVCNRLEVQPRILRHLQRGPVVADRWSASGRAYGACEGLDRAWLSDVQSSLVVPDLTVLLDLPPEVAARRRVARDLNERDLDKRRRVRLEYLALAGHESDWSLGAKSCVSAAEGGWWLTVDATRPAAEVLEEAWLAVRNLLRSETRHPLG